MDGRALHRRAATVDSRSLMVECPDHKGLLLPVTDIHISYTKESKGDGTGDRDRLFVLFVEALCVYCNTYKYLRVKEGASTRFSDEEQAQLTAVCTLVNRCPGMLLEEVLDTMTVVGGSRAMLATVMHMGMKASIAGFHVLEGRLYPEKLVAPTAIAVVI